MPVIYKNKKFSNHFQVIIRHTYKAANEHRSEVSFYQYFLTCRTTKLSAIKSYPIKNKMDCVIEARFVSGVCDQAIEAMKKKIQDRPIQDIVLEAQKIFRDG